MKQLRITFLPHEIYAEYKQMGDCGFIANFTTLKSVKLLALKIF